MIKRSLIADGGTLLLAAGCADVQNKDSNTASQDFLQFTEQPAKLILQRRGPQRDGVPTQATKDRRKAGTWRVP